MDIEADPFNTLKPFIKNVLISESNQFPYITQLTFLPKNKCRGEPF